MEIKFAVSQPVKTKGQIPFRILFDDQRLIAGYVGDKRNIVVFAHRMGSGNIQFILHRFDRQPMLRGCLDGRQCRQSSPATGNIRVAGRGCQIPAMRANEYFQFIHIPADSCITRHFPGQDFFNINPQYLRQAGKQGQVGATEATLPFADRLVADIHEIGDLFLRHSLFFSQTTNQSANFFTVHGYHLAFSVAEMEGPGNKRTVESPKNTRTGPSPRWRRSGPRVSRQFAVAQNPYSADFSKSAGIFRPIASADFLLMITFTSFCAAIGISAGLDLPDRMSAAISPAWKPSL